MSYRVTLTPKELKWLGSAFEEKSRISLFHAMTEEGFSENDKAPLREKGVLDGDDALTADAYALLRDLAAADSYSGFRVGGTFGRIDKVAYFCEGRTVVCDNLGDGFLLSRQSDPHAVAALLNEITGISHLVNATLNVKLDPVGARILAGLIDLTRRAALLACTETVDVPVAFTPEEILGACGFESPRWIGSYLKTLRLPDGHVDEERTLSVLKVLAEAGIAAETDAGWQLIWDAMEFAVKFLVIEHGVHARAGKADGDQIRYGEALFLQAGLHDVLMIDSDGEAIEFSTLSTSAMVEILQRMVQEKPAL